MCPKPSTGYRQDYDTLWRGKLVIGYDPDRPTRCRTWVLAVSKRFAARGLTRGGVTTRATFSGFDYARIAAINGRMPIMFITLVRL
jgi:hypothetical protein